MKKFSYSALVVALLLPATAVLAQQKMGDMKPMDSAMKPSAESKVTHKATGVVKKVDSKTGVVTLAHEAVNSMNWPPMTMGFMVNDKMLLDKLPVGKKVNFEFMQDAKGYVFTSVQ
ncbi:copper-binding protein [Rhodoferax sp. TS-BS-61-7]|uniref:copper-binding protein n=1 Tax=Rhodoferax sp. TS-BS-61-7 TaxID=2094194 RepID=UPI000CF6B464|nr:copper-binding protein [Rhodoferax sp. TS-BS-61-7]PQA79238.1 hypothetical protein C5F53_04650 [Rhodoferax sp. TS-BS-61-7]